MADESPENGTMNNLLRQLPLDPCHEKFDDPPLGSRGASSLRSVRSAWPRPYGLRPRLRGGYAARRGSGSRAAPSTTWQGSRISAPCGGSRPMGKQPSRAQASAEQQAQACCALNTGCPHIGVCFPSFGGLAGAGRIRMMSAQRERIVSALYTASSGLCNLLLKSRYFRLSADACGCVFLEVAYLTAPMPFRIPAMPVAATSLTIIPSSSNE